jgi:hypothetical protein
VSADVFEKKILNLHIILKPTTRDSTGLQTAKQMGDFVVVTIREGHPPCYVVAKRLEFRCQLDTTSRGSTS